jgi:plastocyanin
MRCEYLFPAFVAFTLAGSFASPAARRPDDTKAGAGPATVTIKSLKFDPKTLEVRAGDSVVWTNHSRTTHTATSDDDGKTFDTTDIEPGKSSKAVKFEKEGEFKYHCKVHGKTMSGTVVVKAAEKK